MNGQYDELVINGRVYAHECHRCRSLTMNRAGHDQWHDTLTAMFRAAGVAITTHFPNTEEPNG